MSMIEDKQYAGHRIDPMTLKCVKCGRHQADIVDYNLRCTPITKTLEAMKNDNPNS